MHVPRFDVRGDRAKRYRQLVEILDVAYRHGEVAEYQVELLALHQAERQLRPPAFQADIQVDRVVPGVLLAAEPQVAAFRFVRHGIGPVHFGDQFLELGNAHAGGIQAPDDRSHARARNRIDRYAHALEFA